MIADRIKSPDCLGEQRPDTIADRPVVRVDDDIALLVTGEMHLPNPLQRQTADVFEGVETVIVRADEDIVHVEQQAAARATRHLRQKLPLGHLVLRKGDVARRILEQHNPAKTLLRMVDIVAHHLQRFPRQWQRKKIVAVVRARAGPAKVIRHP